METISETNVGKFPNAIVDFGFVEWSCWLNSIEVHWNEDHGDLEWKKIMRSKFPHFFLVFNLFAWSLCCKGVNEVTKLAYANETSVHHFPETWLLGLLTNCQ